MRTLLIVDDEYVPKQRNPEGNYMWYYVKEFKEANFDVVSAKGPAAAKTKLRKKTLWSLIILDLMMPLENQSLRETAEQQAGTGAELTEWIVKKYPQIPIVVLTNTLNTSIHARLKPLLPKGHIFVKTETTPGELVKAVKELLGIPA